MVKNDYDRLISVDNIFSAWQKFSSGKTDKEEVVMYWRNLEDNLFELHEEFISGRYAHSPYEEFIVYDHKKRIINKAAIKDRIAHRMIFDYLEPIYEKRFFFDSYASRVGKGTHAAVRRASFFCKQAREEGRNQYILKGDIRKYFNNIDHELLFLFIKRKIKDENILGLIRKIIDSFEICPGKGLPLGNLTSQLFANIYLHELDHYVKHILRIKRYVRFNDDFIIIGQDKNHLRKTLDAVRTFLKEELLLDLPDEKVSLRKSAWGADFLGYVNFKNGMLLRKNTKQRMMRKIRVAVREQDAGKISFNGLAQIVNSYFGILKHASAFRLRRKILFLLS